MITFEALKLEDRAFTCSGYPCPKCGNDTVLGFYYRQEQGRHQHTHYVCQFWGSGGTADENRCGWHGWVIPTADRRTLCDACGAPVDLAFHESSGGLCGYCLANAGLMMKVVPRDGG